MIWNKNSYVYGDIIRVRVKAIFHYGVYLSDSEVIQFGKNPSDKEYFNNRDIQVLSTDINEFSFGAGIEVAEFTEEEINKVRTKKEIGDIAKMRLGERGYSFFYYNCEHFVLGCAYKDCNDVINAKTAARFVPHFPLYVYVSTYPFILEDTTVYPESRKLEIDNCSNEKTKQEKYWVWKLLEYALKDAYGMDIKSMEFTKEPNGKWVNKDICFSLSHSHGVIAVSISKVYVGVDVQKVEAKDQSSLMDKILTNYEKEYSDYLNENGFYKTFAIKEAMFKASNDDAFIPRKYSSLVKHNSQIFNYNGSDYVLTIAGPNVENAIFRFINCLKND